MDKNKLVESAKKRARKVQDMEDLLEKAKQSYHRSIKLLHDDGLSYREIARELTLSHQRVHQIVSTQPDLPVKPKKEQNCSFCKDTESKKRKLLKSKSFFICQACLNQSSKALSQTKGKSKKHRSKKSEKDSKAKCLFCSHFASKKRDLVQFKKNHICSLCVDNISQKK